MYYLCVQYIYVYNKGMHKLSIGVIFAWNYNIEHLEFGDNMATIFRDLYMF